MRLCEKEAKKAMKTNVDGHSYQPLDAVFLKAVRTLDQRDSRGKSRSLFSYTPSPLESSDSSSSSYTNSFRKSFRKKMMIKTRSGRNVHRRTSSRSGKKTKTKYTAGLVEDEDDIDSDDDFVDSPPVPKKNIIERTKKISQYVLRKRTTTMTTTTKRTQFYATKAFVMINLETRGIVMKRKFPKPLCISQMKTLQIQ